MIHHCKVTFTKENNSIYFLYHRRRNKVYFILTQKYNFVSQYNWISGIRKASHNRVLLYFPLTLHNKYHLPRKHLPGKSSEFLVL